MTATQNTEFADTLQALVDTAKKQTAAKALQTLKPAGLVGTARESKTKAIRDTENRIAMLRRQAVAAAAKETAPPTETPASDDWFAAMLAGC